MIHDQETGWTEPTITINGRALTFAEAMTVRVAVSSFRMFVNEPSNRKGLGAELATNYDARLAAVESYMRIGG
jgi:hypothetical protein